MAIDSYATLQTAVANWLDRTDLTSRIPEFITLAEAEFNRRLRTRDMLTRDDAFAIDGRYEDLPTGFLGVLQFTLQTTPAVDLQDLTAPRVSVDRQRFPSSGVPIYYSVVGDSFEFLPSPSGSYTATLLYYQRITPLSDSATSNWLLAAHPDLYLWGALKAAEPFVHNDERLPIWSAQYEAGIAQLEREDSRARRGVPTTRGRSFG